MPLSALATCFLALSAPRLAPKPLPVDALLYSTMPSTASHRPEMAMDRNAKTAFRSYYGMEDGDSFTVILSRPIPVRSIEVTTGSGTEDLLTDAILETSSDGATFAKKAAFGANGVATAKSLRDPVMAIRIRMNPGRAASHLQIDEITLDSAVPVAAVLPGPPRGFIDLSQAPDLAGWAAEAEKKMEAFWPDTAALLYSDGFIVPNTVNVVYRTGPGVTDVAATGGGVMTVNSAYCRQNPGDTGLVVHEAAHVVQSGGSPGWLIEAVADYIRWIKFEPENFQYAINLKTATPHEPYRNGAAFLGWCELHYDSKLVTKLNDATRFGRYRDELFEQYCGKPIDVLWNEFIAAYKADKPNLLKKPLSPAMQPRELPAVSGATESVSIPYDKVGVVDDGAKFAGDGGFDDGGAAYSGTLLKRQVVINGVTFDLAARGTSNILVANGQTIGLTGSHKSLWILAAAVDGVQSEQNVTVTYADGTSTKFAQNFSDWFQPQGFPGELKAVKMEYRDMADGSRDPRPFYVYAYGYPVDSSKPLKNLVLPRNPNIRVLAVSVGD